MSPPTTAPPEAPHEDTGTGSADAVAPGRPRAPGGRVRQRLLVGLLVVLLVGVPAVAALLGLRSSGRDLDPDSPAPAGARALAQLLDASGVPVERVSRAAAAQDALEGPGSATLVVTDPRLLDPALLSGLTAAAADVVLLGADETSLEATGADLALRTPGGEPLLAAATPVASGDDDGEGGGDGDGVVPAGCDDPDAVAAGEATGGDGPLAPAGDGAQVCFDGTYGVGTAPSGAGVRVLAAPELASNELLDTAGNAALALRAAGQQPRVVWLVASPLDVAPDAAPSPLALLPGWVAPVGLQLAVLAAAVVLWRSRRFGALVVEPLPVVVRSVETARGRAALYRASRDRASAARALRAAVRWRLQARLGLPPGTDARVLAAGAAHAARSGGDRRWSPQAVEDLLAGPPPPDDAALAALLRDLDAFEAALASGAATTTTTTEEHP